MPQEPDFSGFAFQDAQSGMFVTLQEGDGYVRVLRKGTLTSPRIRYLLNPGLNPSCTSSSLHSFIQQIFIKHLLRADSIHCSRHSGQRTEKIDKMTILVDNAFNMRRWLIHRQTNKISSDRDKQNEVMLCRQCQGRVRGDDL